MKYFRLVLFVYQSNQTLLTSGGHQGEKKNIISMLWCQYWISFILQLPKPNAVLIKWYIDVLNVSEAMIKMCGNKEVVLWKEINALLLLLYDEPIRFAKCLGKIPFCLSSDNENKWQIMPLTLLRIFVLSLNACRSLSHVSSANFPMPLPANFLCCMSWWRRSEIFMYIQSVSSCF